MVPEAPRESGVPDSLLPDIFSSMQEDARNDGSMPGCHLPWLWKWQCARAVHHEPDIGWNSSCSGPPQKQPCPVFSASRECPEGTEPQLGVLGKQAQILVRKRKAEMFVEAARRRLWRAAGDRAGFSEQGTFMGCIRVSDIPEPWFLASCPFLILKDALMQGDILQGFLPNWVYLLPCFYEDRQTWGLVWRHQLCFRRTAKWGKCLARSVNLISVSIFLLNVRAWEGAGIQSRAFIKPYTEDTLAWSSYTDLFLYSAQVPCPLAVMSCQQNRKQCQHPPAPSAPWRAQHSTGLQPQQLHSGVRAAPRACGSCCLRHHMHHGFHQCGHHSFDTCERVWVEWNSGREKREQFVKK